VKKQWLCEDCRDKKMEPKQFDVHEIEKIVDEIKIEFPYPKQSKFILDLKEFEKWFSELRRRFKYKLKQKFKEAK
jgi:hypothetical protein